MTSKSHSSTTKTGLILECALLWLLTCALVLGIYLREGLAPFGPRSFAYMDANIQYLDFFAYLKDVLQGNARLGYSFSSVLGGNTVGMFAYYLASPVNALLVFFPKEKLTSFFDIAVAVKLALGAVSMRVFLWDSEKRTLPHAIVAWLLSLSFALSQYNFEQSSNIMWLDGMYMLPLIMLGVRWCVQRRTTTLLSISVALSVLFNWYSGAINCLFSVLWFVFELFWLMSDDTSTLSRREILGCIGAFALGLLAGVLLSGVLFVPTLFSMQASKAGLDLSLLKRIWFTANPRTLIPGFSLGARSAEGRVCLWCGSLVLSGAILSFSTGRFSPRRSIALFVTLLVYSLIFYWGISDAFFSLFKKVGSYWYRYSYGSIAAFVAIAQLYWTHPTQRDKVQSEPLRFTALVSMAVFMLYADFAYPRTYDDFHSIHSLASAAFLLLIPFLVSQLNSDGAKRILGVVGAYCVLVELLWGASILTRAYSIANAGEHESYVQNKNAQLEALFAYDSSAYRINETRPRYVSAGAQSQGLVANYNEALAFAYKSIAGYSSTPDDRQTTFLNALGYRRNSRAMCITNDTVLAADSLLGVKYILSITPIEGLPEVEGLTTSGEEHVYENTFALPLAFSCAELQSAPSYANNPFTYQNELYSALLGKPIEIYRPVSFERSEKIIGNRKHVLLLGSRTKDNTILYLNIPWSRYAQTILYITNLYVQPYSCWLSPSVVRIPLASGEVGFSLSYEVEDTYDGFEEEQIFELDLDELARVSQEISSRSANITSWDDGHVVLELDVGEHSRLVSSIPYSENWYATEDGAELSVKPFAETLLTIELLPGHHEIELNYRVPGIFEGALSTGFGLVLLLLGIYQKRRRGARANIGRER